MRNNNSSRQDQMPVGYDIGLISSSVYVIAHMNNLFMSINRIQRILYYIQARSLIENNRPFFQEDIIARNEGLYIKESYKYLRENIFNQKDLSLEGLLIDLRKIDRKDKDMIKEVIRSFQALSSYDLSVKIREEEPWHKAMKTDSRIISKESISEFFKASPENTSRLYGVYRDDTGNNIIDQLFLDPRSSHLEDTKEAKDFYAYIDDSLSKSGLADLSYHSINDVLGYVCDFLVYKERAVTIKELEAILYFIQKMFLKELKRPCFNEFIYKNKDSVSIGRLDQFYNSEKKIIDEDFLDQREYDYYNLEREKVADLVKVKLLQVKANRFAYEDFSKEELAIMDMVLNKFLKLPGFHILNIVQNEEAWKTTALNDTISVRKIYEL